MIRLAIALLLSAVLVGGFIYGGTLWRIAPFVISTVWAVVEMIIEWRRRSARSSADGH